MMKKLSFFELQKMFHLGNILGTMGVVFSITKADPNYKEPNFIATFYSNFKGIIACILCGKGNPRMHCNKLIEQSKMQDD